jgi:hypothetical protein
VKYAVEMGSVVMIYQVQAFRSKVISQTYFHFFKIGKVMFFCLIKNHIMKTYGQWKYNSTISDLGTVWRWVVSFTPLPLYPRVPATRYPVHRKLHGPPEPGRYGEEKSFSCLKWNPRYSAK